MVHSICILSIQVTWIEFLNQKRRWGGGGELYISGRGTEYRDNPQGSSLVLVVLKSELGETNPDYNEFPSKKKKKSRL